MPLNPANGFPGSKCEYPGGSERNQLAKTEAGTQGDTADAPCGPGLQEFALSDSERHPPRACARMPITPGRNWKTPEVPAIGSQLNEIWSIHSAESHPAVQKDEVGFHVSTWNYFQDTL